MQEFPHIYSAAASGGADGDIELTARRLPALQSASPPEFDGPGDRWSPETLLVAAIADCFILTFRAVARFGKLDWSWVTCDVSGTLERPERTTQFTRFDVRVRLAVPAGTDRALAMRLIEKADHSCLITNSLKGEVVLKASIEFEAETAGWAGRS